MGIFFGVKYMDVQVLNQFHFTRDEFSTLRFLIKGIKTEAICTILGIHSSQYQAIIDSILNKTGMDNLLELGMWVAENMHDTIIKDSIDLVMMQ